MNQLTHTDKTGKAVMVDISEKGTQMRTAKAYGHITMAAATIRLIKENLIKKGDVITVAQLAGINAAKQTSNLIPLCHNILLEKIDLDVFVDDSGITAESMVKCTGKTGVEMEALTAVTVSLLTVYDMCKAADKSMVIDKVILIEKIKK